MSSEWEPVEPEWKSPVWFTLDHRPGILSNLTDVHWIAASNAESPSERINWARCGRCGHAEKGPDWDAVLAAFNAHDCGVPVDSKAKETPNAD